MMIDIDIAHRARPSSFMLLLLPLQDSATRVKESL